MSAPPATDLSHEGLIESEPIESLVKSGNHLVGDVTADSQDWKELYY
jgi:hypothetical protein